MIDRIFPRSAGPAASSIAIEACFFAKLARAKNKTWYLRIQAGELVSSHPETALRLIADARSLPFGTSMEDANPLFRTWVYVELPVLIATERKSALYDQGRRAATKNRDRPHFPAEFYKWHGAQALILHDRGETAQALDEARQALQAAGMTHSGFQRHPEVGLVTDTSDTFGTRIKEIAGEPSSSSGAKRSSAASWTWRASSTVRDHRPCWRRLPSSSTCRCPTL